MIKLEGYQKGINLGGWLSQGSLERSHIENFITEDDIKRIKEIGCDHLRLPVDFENIYDEKAQKPVEIGYEFIDKCIEMCKKCELNVVLDLHKAPGYTFDDQEYSANFFKDTKLQNVFLDIWDNLSKRYAKYSDMMMFEMLNEVTSFDVIDEWNDLALRCIKVIRKNAPKVKILYGGVGYSSVTAVKYIPAPYDENIVFNVHCYEPMVFSHQGAYWMEKMDLCLGMPYPVDEKKYHYAYENVPSIKYSLLGDADNALKLLKKDFFINLFKEAVECAEKYNVPLYCGEYGVIDQADPASTLNWIKDINNAFRHYGIGRALWSYKKMDFGLIDEHYKPIYSEMIKYL